MTSVYCIKRYRLIFCAVWLAFCSLSGQGAGALFLLGGTNQSNPSKFCFNADSSNPKTRLWFLPGSEDRLGCVFFGFDDGWAQSGLNAKGLAFAWTDGFKEKWEPPSGLEDVPGSPSERMLKTCATVDEAVRFFKTHKETAFSHSKIFVADRSGASAVIGANNGLLDVQPSTQTRAFGYAEKRVDKLLKAAGTNAAAVLRACRQEGQSATQHGAVFDLASGDILLLLLPELKYSATLNLQTELAKGPHYYDIPSIREQLDQPPMPLLENMRRRYLNELAPLEDQQPELTRRVQSVLNAAQSGELSPEDFTPEAWGKLDSRQKELKAGLQKLGVLRSLSLMDQWDEGERRVLRFRAEYDTKVILYGISLADQDKISFVLSEEIQTKPTPPAPPAPVVAIEKPAVPVTNKPPGERLATLPKKQIEQPAPKPAEKPVEKKVEKPVEKKVEKPAEKKVEKPAEKKVEKPVVYPPGQPSKSRPATLEEERMKFGGKMLK